MNSLSTSRSTVESIQSELTMNSDKRTYFDVENICSMLLQSYTSSCIKFKAVNVNGDGTPSTRKNAGLMNPRLFPFSKYFQFVDMVQEKRFERLMFDVSQAIADLRLIDENENTVDANTIREKMERYLKENSLELLQNYTIMPKDMYFSTKEWRDRQAQMEVESKQDQDQLKDELGDETGAYVDVNININTNINTNMAGIFTSSPDMYPLHKIREVTFSHFVPPTTQRIKKNRQYKGNQLADTLLQQQKTSSMVTSMPSEASVRVKWGIARHIERLLANNTIFGNLHKLYGGDNEGNGNICAGDRYKKIRNYILENWTKGLFHFSQQPQQLQQFSLVSCFHIAEDQFMKLTPNPKRDDEGLIEKDALPSQPAQNYKYTIRWIDSLCVASIIRWCFHPETELLEQSQEHINSQTSPQSVEFSLVDICGSRKMNSYLYHIFHRCLENSIYSKTYARKNPTLNYKDEISYVHSWNTPIVIQNCAFKDIQSKSEFNESLSSPNSPSKYTQESTQDDQLLSMRLPQQITANNTHTAQQQQTISSTLTLVILNIYKQYLLKGNKDTKDIQDGYVTQNDLYTVFLQKLAEDNSIVQYMRTLIEQFISKIRISFNIQINNSDHTTVDIIYRIEDNIVAVICQELRQYAFIIEFGNDENNLDLLEPISKIPFSMRLLSIINPENDYKFITQNQYVSSDSPKSDSPNSDSPKKVHPFDLTSKSITETNILTFQSSKSLSPTSSESIVPNVNASLPSIQDIVTWDERNVNMNRNGQILLPKSIYKDTNLKKVDDETKDIMSMELYKEKAQQKINDRNATNNTTINQNTQSNTLARENTNLANYNQSTLPDTIDSINTTDGKSSNPPNVDFRAQYNLSPSLHSSLQAHESNSTSSLTTIQQYYEIISITKAQSSITTSMMMVLTRDGTIWVYDTPI